jgi:hypothetical protein
MLSNVQRRGRALQKTEQGLERFSRGARTTGLYDRGPATASPDYAAGAERFHLVNASQEDR